MSDHNEIHSTCDFTSPKAMEMWWNTSEDEVGKRSTTHWDDQLNWNAPIYFAMCVILRNENDSDIRLLYYCHTHIYPFCVKFLNKRSLAKSLKELKSCFTRRGHEGALLEITGPLSKRIVHVINGYHVTDYTRFSGGGEERVEIHMHGCIYGLHIMLQSQTPTNIKCENDDDMKGIIEWVKDAAPHREEFCTNVRSLRFIPGSDRIVISNAKFRTRVILAVLFMQALFIIGMTLKMYDFY
jgi:hypothetical protein